jgi:hypothetical protein
MMKHENVVTSSSPFFVQNPKMRVKRALRRLWAFKVIAALFQEKHISIFSPK